MFRSFVVLSPSAHAAYATKFKLWISWECLVQLFALFSVGPIKSCSLIVFFPFSTLPMLLLLFHLAMPLCLCCIRNFSNLQYQETECVYIFHSNNIAFIQISLYMRSRCLAFVVHIAHGYNVIVMKMKKKIFFFFVLFPFVFISLE